MSDNGAALNPDRLPWLMDEPPSTRIGTWAAMLLIAVLITLLFAYFRPWANFIRAAQEQASSAAKSRDVDVADPGEHKPGIYQNVQTQPLPNDLPATASITAVERQTAAPEIGRRPDAVTHGATVSNATSIEPAAGPLSSGGFDCRFARTQGASAVCNNADLAALDRDHALLFNQSWMQANPAKRALLSRARQRLFDHRNGCRTEVCARGIYLAAMRELSAIMTAKVAVSRAAQRERRFSCRSTKTRGEITLCHGANLAALDRHQVLLYGQSWGRADAAKRARLLRVREQLITRRDACGTEECATRVYLTAMSEVRDIMTKR